MLAICGPYRTGKSFFISRVVEKPGTFKLGHSMEACTRGIWLSTTALECDEFVLLVLDTEGIGAVEGEGPESFTTKLLVATILLSSFLIYNSTEVPKQADLQQMRSVQPSVKIIMYLAIGWVCLQCIIDVLCGYVCDVVHFLFPSSLPYMQFLCPPVHRNQRAREKAKRPKRVPEILPKVYVAPA